MPAMHAFYDLANSPPTFDFGVFMLNAAAYRAARHPHIPLQVHLVPGPHGFRFATERDKLYSVPRKLWRLHNVLMPLGRMVKDTYPPILHYHRMDAAQAEVRIREACEPIFPEGYSLADPRPAYRFKVLLATAADGTEVRHLLPSIQAMDWTLKWIQRGCGTSRVVTITLRQSDYQLWRNSDLEVWRKVAWALQEMNYVPVIIPDTEALLDGTSHSAMIGRYVVNQAAAVSLDIRAALYHLAHTNLLVANGPGVLCYGSQAARYITCNLLRDGEVASNAEFWQREGLPVGTQPPFASLGQRWMWSTRQDADEILDHFQQHERELAELNERRSVKPSVQYISLPTHHDERNT